MNDNLEARAEAVRKRWADRLEQDRLRQIEEAKPEHRAQAEKLAQQRRAERERMTREADEANRRASVNRNYKAEEHLRRIEAGLPHDGHPLDPDWDCL